jgi:hypothetical protein
VRFVGASLSRMDLGEPPPDPYAGMTPAERKRALEAGRDMAYDRTVFAGVNEGERPNFTLWRDAAAEFFGVEVTQSFPSEARARLNLVSGYMHRLGRVACICTGETSKSCSL